MKIIILITAVILLGACSTKYEFTRCTAVDVCSTAKISSRREFEEGISVEYNPKTGAFKVEADRVTQKENPLEQLGADVVNKLLNELLLRQKQ